jgi:hypothetical protein
MRRCVWMIFLLIAGNALAQPNPMLRLNPQSAALYKEAEGFAARGDTAAVIAVWRDRADRGDDLAQFEIAIVLLADPALKEGARAVDLLRRSAASGFVRAQTRLGLLLRDGLPPHLAPDPAQSFALLKRAADQGYPIAMVQLGLAYANGIGVAPDPKAAFALFQQAARLDQPFGHFAVGAAYESGIGVPVDLDKARDAYRIAIERALWFQSRLGFPYVFRPAFDKWVVDSRAALAGLEGAAAPTPTPTPDPAIARAAEERRRLEAEQARIAEERRKVDAENARLAAERRRLAEEQARRQAEEAKRAEEARLAEERRRLEAERARLTEERRRLEEENRRAVDQERRQAAERKATEEAQLAEEKRRLEAEQARIADERRKVEADNARLADERRKAAEAESRAKAQAEQAARSAPPPAAKPAAPARPAGDSDFAASFGRFARGLATAAQAVAGVAVAVSGARAGDDARINQGVDLILIATGNKPAQGTGPGPQAGQGGTDPRNVSRDQCIADWTKARAAMAEVVRQSNQYAQHLETPGAPYRPPRPVEDCKRDSTYRPAQRDFQEVNALVNLCGVVQANCVIDRVSAGEECASAMDYCKAEHPLPNLR